MKLLILPILLSICSFSIAEEFDHVETIQGLRHGDVKEGRKLYALHCASCHGKDGKLSLNPLARKFAEDELKFGADPYSLWKTTSYGNGLMFRWDAVLTPKQRYQIVHHIREEIIKPNNEAQYFVPDEEYFEKLPAIAKADAKAQEANTQKVEVAQGMIDGTGGTAMIYGPFLQHGVSYTDIKDKNAKHMENTTEKAMVVDIPGEAVVWCLALGRSVQELATTGGFFFSHKDLVGKYSAILFGITNSLAQIPGFLVPLLIAWITPNVRYFKVMA